jgi:hypothetical protein
MSPRYEGKPTRFCRQRLLGGRVVTVVHVFALDGRHVADLGVQAVVVEPVHPAQRGELEVVEAAPGAVVADTLGLVETDGALGQGVVVALSG